MRLPGFLYRLRRNEAPTPEALEGMARAQALAYACAKDIAREMKEGWTEAQTARLMDVYLQDNGVRAHFHKSFAWFGERSRFDGMTRWRDFLPSARALKTGECVVLDTAPVLAGFPADIGYPTSLGPNEDLEKGREFLARLRETIRGLFEQGVRGSGLTGGDICEAIARKIREEGYDVVHHRYPGAVLGHRLRPMSEGWRPPTFIPFSWQTLSAFVREGIVPDLLNEAHEGDLQGAWAIEPHFGGKGYGLKFEEILVADQRGARWLSRETPWSS